MIDDDRDRLPPTRRRVLLGGLAGAVLVALPTALTSPARAEGDLAAGRLEPIRPLTGPVDRELFALDEQRLAGYLVTLAAMVNEIDDSDSDRRGYFAGGWWRTPSEPFNARISEHVFTLAWFLTQDRPWNPYRHDPALRQRLEVALGYYLSLQHDDGSWPEYEPGERSRAATAFGLGYLGKTLKLLREAGRPSRHDRAITAALRRAMTWFLDPDNEAVWLPEFVEFANQPAAGLAGAALALELDPDPTLRRRLFDRIGYLARYGQSSAGFFHEPRGMDIAYNLNVTLAELHELRLLTRSPLITGMVERFADWLGRNLVAEPDGSGYIANISGSARTPTYFIDALPPDRQQRDIGSLFCPDVPELRPFFPAREDRAAQRRGWRADPAPVPEFARGDTNPRIVVNVGYGEAFPTRAERETAIRKLPYLRRRRWTELRPGPLGQQYLFARRPGYYTFGFFGRRPNGLVRSGLGLLWHPDGGTFVHSGHNAPDDCWGTVVDGVGVDAAGDLELRCLDRAGNVLSDPSAIAKETDLTLSWRTGSGRVAVTASLEPHGLTKQVTVAQPCQEQIPLLLRPEDELWTADGGRIDPAGQAGRATGLRIRRGDTTLTLDWHANRPWRLDGPIRTYFAAASRTHQVLRVGHDGPLRIDYRFG